MTAITRQRQPSRLLPRLLMAPAVGTLFLWMIVPRSSGGMDDSYL